MGPDGRATSICGATQGASYTYRADGMRVRKVGGLTVAWEDDKSEESKKEASGYYDEYQETDRPTTRYFYDGQMCFEEEDTWDGETIPIDRWVRRNALGARGIDMIATTAMHQMGNPKPRCSPSTTATATWSRRSQETAHRSRSRTHASTTHGEGSASAPAPQSATARILGIQEIPKADSCICARDITTRVLGRFISEDPARDGLNWYAYCGNDPIGTVDRSGKYTDPMDEFYGKAFAAAYGLGPSVMSLIRGALMSPFGKVVAASGMAFLASWFDFGLGDMLGNVGANRGIFGVVLLTVYSSFVVSLGLHVLPHIGGVKQHAVAVGFAYSGVLGIFLSIEFSGLAEH